MIITNSSADQLMVLAAFNYCLNRETYIVGEFVDWAKEHWSQFTAGTQSIITRDLRYVVKRNLPREIDAANQWTHFLDWIEKRKENPNA